MGAGALSHIPSAEPEGWNRPAVRKCQGAHRRSFFPIMYSAFSHPPGDRGTECVRAQRTTHIPCSRGGIRNACHDSQLDCPGAFTQCVAIAAIREPFQQHPRGQHNGTGIGDILTRYIRCRPMSSLSDRMPQSGIERARKAEPTCKFRGFIRENIAEHIRGDDNVERTGFPDEVRRHRVDKHFLNLKLRKCARARRHGLKEQPVAEFQDIRLGDDRQFLPAGHGQLGGRTADPLPAG